MKKEKKKILGQALESAFKLKNNGMKVQALLAIIPYLDESKQREISVKVIYFKHMIQSKYLHMGAVALLQESRDTFFFGSIFGCFLLYILKQKRH